MTELTALLFSGAVGSSARLERWLELSKEASSSNEEKGCLREESHAQVGTGRASVGTHT